MPYLFPRGTHNIIIAQFAANWAICRLYSVVRIYIV